ncbi:Lys-63-specific deubiquitinase BRCC36-like protein [Tanacetum coccineum]
MSDFVGRIQVTAFQSLDGKQSRALRAVPVSPINKSSIIDLKSSLSRENSLTNSGSTWGKSSALKGFFVDADRVGGNYPTGNIESSVVDIGPMDMSESMQEALHRSNLEVSGAEYVRKEVPLHVLPTLSLFNLESSMTTFTDLQSVLYEEERTHVYQRDGNEVFFRIERSTQLKKLISAYCDRKSVEINSIAFLFDGRHLRGEHTPDESSVLLGCVLVWALILGFAATGLHLVCSSCLAPLSALYAVWVY